MTNFTRFSAPLGARLPVVSNTASAALSATSAVSTTAGVTPGAVSVVAAQTSDGREGIPLSLQVSTAREAATHAASPRPGIFAPMEAFAALLPGSAATKKSSPLSEAEFLGQAARFETELRLPHLVLDQLPGFVERFQRKYSIHENFFEDTQTQLSRGFSYSLLLEHHFNQFRAVVEKVQSGEMNPHLGVLYLRKIMEANFYEKWEAKILFQGSEGAEPCRVKVSSLTVQQIAQSTVADKLKERLEQWGLLDKQISLFYALSSRSKGRVEEGVDAFLEMLRDDHFWNQRESEEQAEFYQHDIANALYLSNKVLIDGVIADEDVFPLFLPVEVDIHARLCDPKAMNRKIYPRLSELEESIRDIVEEDVWGIAVSAFPIELVHLEEPEKVVHSEQEAENAIMRCTLDPHAAAAHDGYHDRVLDIAGFEVRQCIGWLLRSAQSQSATLGNAFLAFSDALQRTAQVYGEGLDNFLGPQLFATVGDYFCSDAVFNPQWFEEHIVPLVFHPAVDSSRFPTKPPIVSLMDPFLSSADPTHREFVLKVFRRPEVVENLRTRYAPLLAHFPSDFRDWEHLLASVQGY